MSIVDSALTTGWNEAIKHTSGSVTFAGTEVTCILGFIHSYNKDQENSGYNTGYGELTVQLKNSDISSWNLDVNDVVSVVGKNINGDFSVRDPIRYYNDYTWLTLDRTK